MNKIGQLTLAQRLELESIERQSKALTLEQAQGYVVEVMRQIMIRDNLVNHLMNMSESVVRKQLERENLQADLPASSLDTDAHILQIKAS